MNSDFNIPMSTPNFGIEEKEAILKVMDSNWPSQGKVTEEFELLLSDYLNSECVVVNNGSSALMAILLSHGLKPGDKVVVPDLTFVATSSIPKILGAEVLVADVDPLTFNILIESIENLVKNYEVKFVFAVDIGGLGNNIEELKDLAKKYNFILIEDAAQSFGAEYKNQKLGSFEHLTAFSFQSAKQISTIEGGCIASTDITILKKIKQIKDYGRNKAEQYIHDIVGTNFRTTDLQSAIGIQQFNKIANHMEQRTKIANQYKKNIKNITFQKIPDYATRHSYMLFFGLANDQNHRDKIIERLSNNGVDARKIWTPIHLQPCNQELKNVHCENSEKIVERAFTLPIYNNMKIDDANTIISLLNEND